MRCLVTGAAGFIGMHVAERLLARGDTVVGVDNLSDYYDVALKQRRLERLRVFPGFAFERLDVADGAAVAELFRRERPQSVVHLAAQAGVRHSMEAPETYVSANVAGTLSLLEAARFHPVRHLVYASSSAVYGGNPALPFSTGDSVDHPLSLYAATKKANELMAHAYSHLYGIAATGLRFFTVYGPWGRPDMALFRFTRAILADEPIEVFNEGRHRRDFTYVDDVAEGVVRVLDRPAVGDPQWQDAPTPASSFAPHRVYNLGGGHPVELLRFIELIEAHLGRKAKRVLKPMQPGDVHATEADATPLAEAFGFRPTTPVETGIPRFVDWYCDYYGQRRL